MDFSLIIGLLSGLGLIIFGIMDGGQIQDFIDPASMAITFGGTFAAAIMSFPLSTFKQIPRHFKIMVQRNKYKPQKYIDKIVEYAQEARRKGLLALEDKAAQEDDEFLKSCVMLIVDAIEPTKAKEMLENELYCLDQRHSKGWQLYERIAVFAPAFGMIGTLIGLINMLRGLTSIDAGSAAGSLGEGMAVALITTFYGSLLANLVLMPMANRLRSRHAEEILCKELVVEGVLAIHAGTNPRHIEERLKAFINNRDRKTDERSDSPRASKEKGKKAS